MGKRMVCIESQVVAAILRPGRPGMPTLSVQEGVPDDARFERADYDFTTDCFRFLFSHPDWEEVPPNTRYPELFPVFYQQAPEGGRG